MRVQSAVLCLTIAFFLPAFAATAQPPGPRVKVVSVNCDEGESIQEVLSQPAHRLVVEISGTCVEDVVVERDRVTLRGVTPGATIEGDATVPGPIVSILGASAVDLVDLTIRGGDSLGVLVRRNGEAQLQRVQILDTFIIGLLVDLGSAAFLENTTVRNHGVFGAAVFGRSGITVRGTNEFSANGVIGLLMSNGASLHTQGVGTLVASDNGVSGVALQAGAAGLFPSVVAQRNGFAGVDLAFSAFFNSIGTNNLSDNGAFGTTLIFGSQVLAAGDIRNNGVAGIQATGDSVVHMSTDVPSRIDGSPSDVVMIGASGIFDTIAIGTMDLSFGSRATFFPGASVTTLLCDATVLTRGGISCPATASSLSTVAGASRDGASAKSIEEVAQEMGMPRPPYQLPDF